MTSLQLLYVDDEPDIREVATFALELDPEIAVTEADCGAAALALLDSGSCRPDVILLDVMMPNMDGPTTLAEIRRRPGLERTPTIFITARAQVQEQESYLARGAIGVITKPFDPMALAAHVRALLAAG